MNKALSKLLVVGTLGVLAAGALAIGRPVPQRAAGELLAVTAPTAPVSSVRTDTIHSGEPLLAVLQRHGLEHDEANRAIADMSLIDARRVRAGTQVTALVHPDSGVQNVTFQLAIDRIVRLVRSGEHWTEIEEKLPWTVDTVAVAGVIASTLTGAIVEAATQFPASARTELAYGIANVLEYRVDLSRDLRVGDSITALVERETAPNGLVRAGRVLATRSMIAGSTIDAVRFDDQDGESQFYDAEGKSLRAGFLRAPLEFRRISSVFGSRKHPVLKTWRKHNGIDYAASTGTPVRAIGDGTVIYAGWKGGYGKTVEIRHRNGMVTRYGHLNAISSGIRNGARVKISSTIGRVGMTGLATGPHLHFETLVNGVHRDPRLALKDISGEPIRAADRTAFALRRNALFADLTARVYAMQDPTNNVGVPGIGIVPRAQPRAVGAGN